MASIHQAAPFQLIDLAVRNRASALREQFQVAQPFPHVVIDSFLDSDYCRDLMAEFPPFDKRRALNEYGEVGRKAVFQNLPHIGSSYARFDGLLRSREFLSFMSTITGIPDLLYDSDYIGGGTHENLSGQGLDAHVDFNYHPKTRAHRRLNLLLYLNPVWKEEWGGALELHSNPWLPPEQNKIATVLPIANRCVVFETSERSWHGFRHIKIPDGQNPSRRSIAVYFYTKDRPAAEIAPDHATVYVHPSLPPNIKAGHTLSETDVIGIRALIERRDQHMKFLYEREKEFSTAIAESSALIKGITNSPTFRCARFLTWPLRRFRDAAKLAGRVRYK